MRMNIKMKASKANHDDCFFSLWQDKKLGIAVWLWLRYAFKARLSCSDLHQNAVLCRVLNHLSVFSVHENSKMIFYISIG